MVIIYGYFFFVGVVGVKEYFGIVYFFFIVNGFVFVIVLGVI